MELREPLKTPIQTQGFGEDFWYYNTRKSVNEWFYKDTYGLKGHGGIDYRANWGTPIYSANDGVVLYAGYDNVNGNLIQIWNEEKGFKTLYGHNSEFKVKTGDKVKAGDLIALSGDTGHGTGPHLHFGLALTGFGGNSLNRDNGYNGAIDPTPYLKYDYQGNLLNFMDYTKWLKDNDLKWVRNIKTGSFGRILQGELKTFQTLDRACLALIDDKVRDNGIQIDDNLWNNLPKNNF